MNHKATAQLSTNEALHQYLNNKEVVALLANDLAANNLIIKFEANRVKSIASAAAAGVNNAGFSTDKLNAKEAMAFKAACMAGSAQVKFDELGKHSLSKQLQDSETYYLHAADSESSTYAQAACDLLTLNLTILTPEFCTAADLLEFQSLINSFMVTQGSSLKVHKISPELTLQLATDLKASRKNTTDLIKITKKYKKSNNVFYKSLVDVSRPKLVVHHNDVLLTIIDQKTGNLIKGAAATLSNSTKTGSSNEEGTILLEEISGGNPTLTIEADEYIKYSAPIHVESGRQNEFKIVLTRIG